MNNAAPKAQCTQQKHSNVIHYFFHGTVLLLKGNTLFSLV